MRYVADYSLVRSIGVSIPSRDYEPVRSVDMQLTDLAGALAGGVATYAWLEETEAQAWAERLDSAEMPDLWYETRLHVAFVGYE